MSNHGAITRTPKTGVSEQSRGIWTNHGRHVSAGQAITRAITRITVPPCGLKQSRSESRESRDLRFRRSTNHAPITVITHADPPPLRGERVQRTPQDPERLAGMRVLGIDPSLTSTGIATLTMAGAVDTTAVVTKGRRDATLTDIDTRLRLIADHVLDHAHDVTLAVIEGPSIGSRGGSPWDRAGLWWRIVHRLLAADIPVASCAPTLRAKWATGKGNASKAQVSVAVSRLWPDVEAGCDDEWDALALATIGAQQLGWNVPTRAHHPACRLRVTWPTELLELEAAS